MKITKRLLKQRLDFTSDAQLADWFGVSKQAVSQWGDDDESIPEGKQWQARALRPDIFGPAPTTGEQEAAA